MDRKRFLKLFGLGVAGIATARITIKEENKITTSLDAPFIVTKEGILKTRTGSLNGIVVGPGLLNQIEYSNINSYAFYAGLEGQESFDKAIKEYVKYLNII